MPIESIVPAEPNDEVIRRALSDKATYIRLSREGITGSMGRSIAEVIGRDVTISVLRTSPKNLARYFRNDRLSKADTEQILDTLRTTAAAEAVWGGKESAQQWLHEPVPALGNEVPIDLMDTFEGRKWVREVLRKIETGDFS